MELYLAGVYLNLLIQFSVILTSSSSLRSFDLTREVGKSGDRFRISVAETNEDKCFEYGASVSESGNGTRLCQCPMYNPTFWFGSGKWRCRNDTAIRSIEGCGILFLNETKTSPLAVVDTSNTQRIVGVSYDTLNRSINCSLDTQRSAYLGCTGTWITPVSSEHAWSSFSLGFIPHTSKLNLTITDGMPTVLKGNLIKLVFRDGCAFSNNTLRRCLIFKLPGKLQCKGTHNEQIPTEPSQKINVHSKEKNPCKTYWNKELSVVVISAVSVVVFLIIVITVLVVILQRRRMREELIKVLQDVEDNASETSGSLRHYVDMTEAQSQLHTTVREQGTQTEDCVFTYGGEEPDYASIRKLTSTPTGSDGGHYYNIATKPGENHDYASLRWHGATGGAGKVAANEESNKSDDEEAEQSLNVASKKGRCKDLQQELIQLVKDSKKRRSSNKLQDADI